jgi:hypothetical protein
LCLAVLAQSLIAGSAARGAGSADRLDRFRALAAARLALVEAVDPARAAETYREIYALIDEEIVESLASGSVFASAPFLQDRLDGFADVWGGASLRLLRVGRLTVGAFQLGDSPGASSLRVYGALHGEPQLLATLHRQGRPLLYPLPVGAGPAGFLVVWEGVATGRGTRVLRLDLVRERGEDIAATWSSLAEFPEGLMARAWRVRGREVRVRYELHYPGWIPGCEPQAEQEDVLRLADDGTALVRVSRRQYNAWHVALHRAVSGLLEALATGNGTVLATLVPDAGLRQRLPTGLARDPACDAPDAPEPAAVSVAAVADERPWALTFRRSGGQWRLTAATPVLQ